MSINKKRVISIIGACVFIVAVLMAGLIYYASTKISPEKIKTIAVEQVSRVFPHATFSIGEVDYSVGLNFKLVIKQVDLHIIDKEKNINLFKVDDVVVKIPIWSILIAMGTIDVKVAKPEVTYYEMGKLNNWTFALGVSEDKSKTPEVDSAQATPAAAPDLAPLIAVSGFLSKIKVNVKFTDIGTNYVLKDGSSGKVLVSKFIVNNISFASPSAFEIASQFNINLAPESVFSMELLTIGQFNLQELLQTQSISTIVMVNLNNISLSNMPTLVIPNIKTDVKVMATLTGTVQGEVLTTFSNRNRVAAKLQIDKNSIGVKNIDVELFLQDLLGMISFNNAMVDASKSRFTLQGNVALVDKKINPDFSFALNPGISLSVEGINGDIQMNGSYKDFSINVLNKIKVLEGKIDSKVAAFFDPNEKEIKIAQMRPFSVDIKAADLNLSEAFLQKMLWSGDASKKVEVAKDEKEANKDGNAKVSKKKQDFSKIVIPAGKIDIRWDNIKIGKNIMQGSWPIVISNKGVTANTMNFDFSGGRGKLMHQTQIEANQIKNRFDFSITNLNLTGFKPFLPPFFKQVQGVFSGLVKGDFNLDEYLDPKFAIDIDVNAKDGELQGINIGEKVKSTVDSISILKGKIKDLDKYEADGKFDSLVFAGKFRNDNYKISKLDFMAINKKFQLTGLGEIFPLSTTETSLLDFNFMDKSGIIAGPMKQSLGTDTLPVRLKGPGIALGVDYGYTAGKIAKSAISAQKQVVVEKAKEELKNKIIPQLKDKLLNQGSGGEAAPPQEQAKKLLKGLFGK